MCGIIGIFNAQNASRQAFFGLFALQHRGQEATGIASADYDNLYAYKNNGLVNQVYDEKTILSLPGHCAIGHNRYATQIEGEAQPIVVSTRIGRIAIAHNGHVINDDTELGKDSHFIAEYLKECIDRGMELRDAAKSLYTIVNGAFSLLILAPGTLIAMKDQKGIRPLCMGSDSHGGFYFASESCAFTPLFVEYNRELEPGEMVVFERNKRHVEVLPTNNKERVCLFELIYTARPDSILLGKSVYEIRREFGRKLASRRVVGDVVVPVPSTSIPAAIGYSQATGIPIEQALVKNQYIHRTFIEPDSRDNKVGMKLSPISPLLENKEVTLIDDSIVRGTTAGKIVQLVRDAGASKVHFLVSSPPVRFPDQTGIDISDPKDLMAANNSIERIKEKIGADSLTYLSLADTIAATGKSRNNFYLGPFTGEY